MFRLIGLLVFTLAFSTARANSDAFFTINEDSLKITEVDSGVLSKNQIQELIGDCSEMNSDSTPVNMLDPKDLGEMINYGKQMWQFIKDNKPVVNVTENKANALPKGVSCWTDLEQWKAPKYKTYRVTYENLFGMYVVDLKFNLFYSYGGKVNGVGNYLANVTVAPMNLDVAWGFNFDAVVEVGQVLNVGTHADPTAGIEMTMKWNAVSPLKDSRGQVRYFVQGDGQSELFE